MRRSHRTLPGLATDLRTLSADDMEGRLAGSAGGNGANDNASGTAALFALAAWFEAHPPRHSLIFAALDAEESGQQGARRFGRFLTPFIEAVAASANVTPRMGHDNPDETGVEDGTRSSDHDPFCQAGIPCLYFGVEDFGNYHRPSDTFDTMTLDFYYRVVQTMALAVQEFDERLEQVAR